MRIVADENIADLQQSFGKLGRLVTLPGRTLAAKDVESADALIVRSVTRVDETLLAGSQVRFVGSCTIGTDHVDLDYLARAGIRFAHAPGCNARAVAEYVVASVFHVLGDLSCWKSKRFGIVGYGNVGRSVAGLLDILGAEWIAHDPLIPQSSARLAGFDAVLHCDVVSLHVPLTRHGRYATHHWFDGKLLRQLAPQTMLINAARGAVVDNSALAQMLSQGASLQVVLDVFENEPAIHAGLLHQLALATPHIAGYSVQGKLRGTWQVLEQLCTYLTMTVPVPELQIPVDLDCRGCDSVRDVILKAYDIAADDSRLRSCADGSLARSFDELRKHYPARHEWSNRRLRGVAQSNLDPRQIQQLRALGFVC